MSGEPPLIRPPDVQRGKKLCGALSSRFIWILAVYGMVLLTQYVLLTYLTPFFPTVADGIGFSEFWTGLIFAGYPIGAVITGPFTAKIIEKVGGKVTVCAGLILAGTFTLLFGLAKDTLHLGSTIQPYFFFVFALLYGAGSALAETGIMIIIENLCPENYLARVISLGEMIIGVGCTIGPLLGGVLFSDAGLDCAHTRESFVADSNDVFLNETHKEKEEDGCWLATFVTMSSLALISAVFVAIVIPGKRSDNDEEDDMSLPDTEQSLLGKSLPSPDDRDREEIPENKTYFQLAIEYRVIPPALIFAGSVMCFSSMTPILALKLSEDQEPPFNMDALQIGLVWLVSAVFYMVVAGILGYLVDRAPEGSFKKYIIIQISMAAGMVLMTGGWFFVGPAQVPGLPRTKYNSSIDVADVDPVTSMDRSIWVVIISQTLLGAGSALYTIPSLPALLFFIPEENEDGDENPHRSFATGLWVTIYSASVALGNLAGSSFYSSLGMRQEGGVVMMWSALIFVCILVWMYSSAKHFQKVKNMKKTDGMELADQPEMGKTRSLQLAFNEYGAPVLPADADSNNFDFDASESSQQQYQAPQYQALQAPGPSGDDTD